VVQSFGWAAGDVSLAAYIQASLARLEAENRNVSPLGAVMAFLYCTYIVTYAITSPVLGRYIDHISNENREDIHVAIKNVGGVQFTIIFILVMTATFVPKGAFAFNPKMLSNEDLDMDMDDDGMDYGPDVDDAKSTKSHEMHTTRTSDSN
jgi:MFS family permease